MRLRFAFATAPCAPVNQVWIHSPRQTMPWGTYAVPGDDTVSWWSTRMPLAGRLAGAAVDVEATGDAVSASGSAAVTDAPTAAPTKTRAPTAGPSSGPSGAARRYSLKTQKLNPHRRDRKKKSCTAP